MTRDDNLTALQVQLPEALEDRVGAFAQAMRLKRSEAIQVLVQAALDIMDEPD